MTREPTEMEYPESIDDHYDDEHDAPYPRGEHEAEYDTVEHDGTANVYATPEVDNDEVEYHASPDDPSAGQGYAVDDLKEHTSHDNAVYYSEDYEYDEDDEMAPPRITRPLPPPPPEVEESTSVPEEPQVTDEPKPPAPPISNSPIVPFLNRPVKGSIRRSESPSLSFSDSSRKSTDSQGPPRRFVPPPPPPSLPVDIGDEKRDKPVAASNEIELSGEQEAKGE